jgi:hypothetical protein
MLVLAPAACIVGGIALSAAFETLTRSIKYAPAALPALLLATETVRLFISFSCSFLIILKIFFAPGDEYIRRIFFS